MIAQLRYMSIMESSGCQGFVKNKPRSDEFAADRYQVTCRFSTEGKIYFLNVSGSPSDFSLKTLTFVYCNVFWRLLHAEPCRIIWYLRQIIISKPNTTIFIESRNFNMSGPAKASPGGQILVSGAGFFFFFSEFTPFLLLIRKFLILIGHVWFSR